MKNVLGAFVFLNLVASACAAWNGCGVSLTLPSNWQASILNRDKVECEIGLQPDNWTELTSSSRWPETSPAITVTLFAGSFSTAARKMDFTRNHAGNWGVEGRGTIAEATEVRYGSFAGMRSEAWFRDYAKDGADTHGESPIYSGSRIVMLLRGPRKLIVGVEYSLGSPDISVDRDEAAKSIVRSLQRDGV
jgi:hypothetical protein